MQERRGQLAGWEHADAQRRVEARLKGMPADSAVTRRSNPCCAASLSS